MKGRNVIAALSLSTALIVTTGWSTFAAETPSSGGTESRTSESQTAEEMLDGADYASRELIVTYSDDVSDKSIEKNVEKHDGTAETIIASGEEEKAVKVTLDKGTDMADAITEFQQDNKTVEVQPNYAYSVTGSDSDPYLNPDRGVSYQYQLELMNAEDAWTALENSGSYATTKVAVIDTGVDTGHEDLQENLSSYVQALDGVVKTAKDDTDSHGTHVSGIIAADYNNGKGGSGLASGHHNDLVDLMVVGCSADGETFYTFDLVNSIQYAMNQGAKVISMSLGGTYRDRVMEKCILDGVENYGVTFVAAAGNDGDAEYNDPASMGEVINVAACDNKGTFASSYSNYGDTVDVMGPGSYVYSTLPGDSYGSMTGTSMATPAVAAVVALMLDANPSLTPDQVQNIICGSTTSENSAFVGTNAGTSVASVGYGMVDAAKAVKNAQAASTSVAADSVTLKTSETTITAGDDTTLEARVLPATSLSKVTWSSDNEAVATVDQNGRVAGLTSGTATITATTENGKTATCTVTVEGAVAAESIQLTGMEDNQELAVGDSLSLEAKVLPSKASNTEVYWESSDPSVATIGEDGILTGKAKGTATITAFTYATPYEGTKDSKAKRIEATRNVIVKGAGSKIILTQTTKWMTVGESFTFEAKLMDANGLSGDENICNNVILWSVNDRTHAKVDLKSGTVTAKKDGVVYVTASYTSKTNGTGFFVDKNQKVIIAKKNYKGKADYNLRQTGKTKNSVTLKWKKNPVASGYVIYQAASKSGTYKQVKKITKGSTVTAKVKVKKNRYYKVKAYYVKDGKTKFYSASNAVKGTVKK